MQQLLMIEDDARLAQMVGEYLERSGFGVTHAIDAKAGMAVLQEPPAAGAPELVILDLMLPDMDGLEVCRRIRALPGEAGRIPVLMLTAKGDPMDRIVGLELGADDYLPKPFGMRELLARVRALLRRGGQVAPAAAAIEREFVSGDLVADTRRREVRKDSRALALKPKEYDLLLFFLQNRGRLFTREQILDDVWGYDFDGGPRTVDVHVRWLRQKIEDDPAQPTRLRTVRGSGYLFEG